MKPLLDWLRSWRQSTRSSKPDGSTKPSTQDHMSAKDLHIDTFTLNKDSHSANKPHHHYTSSSPQVAMPTGHHHHRHHHHHHDLRLLKSSRVTPLDEHEDHHSISNDDYDDDDVDIEFSTMMMASFTTVTRPSSHRAQDNHLTSTMTFSPKRATMPHSISMPKPHPPSPRSRALHMHSPARHSVEGPSMPHSLTPQGSPMVHCQSKEAKKSSRMPRSPLLRVLGRPPLPDSSSARHRDQLPVPQAPSHAVRHPLVLPLSSNIRAKHHPSSLSKSPSTRTKGSSKTPHSPSLKAMAYPNSAPHSPSTGALERQLHSPSPKARQNANGLISPSMHHPSSGLNLPAHLPAQTYQPLCCSSGTCILECHEAETTKNSEAQLAHKKSQPKRPMKYGMTILPSKDGSRHVRRLSFKNGKWILDEPDYVVLEL
ncbi:hypothetical protein L7F22_060515 [Adiantum nelumboides]|nr:hypothetical protein [Adiantum nelumboides]